MGGGGSYYDRDTTVASRRTRSGFSDIAEKKMSRETVNPAVLPAGRKLVAKRSNPLVFAFDVTGSMGTLPKIIFDKVPMIVGELTDRQYVPDPELSLAAIGDVVSDQAPIQIGEFASLRKTDEWLQRLWLEGEGGGQAVESYEYTAYFYARYCTLPDGCEPFLIFTGDEGFREDFFVSELRKHFGPGKYERVTAKVIFAELIKRFKGNVFKIHRRYFGDDPKIVRQWKSVLGENRVLQLGSDLAIADVMLGIIAIMSGKRTLEQYCQDMRTRTNKDTGKIEPQTEKRITEVQQTLAPLVAIATKKAKSVAAMKRPAAKTARTKEAKAKPAKKKSAKPAYRPKAEKPGRL